MSVGETLWSLSWLNICPFLHGAWQWCIIQCESELPHVGFVYPPCCVLSHHLWLSRLRTESNRGKKGISLQDTKRVILGFFHLSFISQNVGENRKKRHSMQLIPWFFCTISLLVQEVMETHVKLTVQRYYIEIPFLRGKKLIHILEFV